MVVPIKAGGGFWKGIGKFLLSPFKFLGWVIGIVFSAKWKISLSVIFAIILLLNAGILAYKEKDATIVFKDVGGRIIMADYNLKQDLTEKQLSFPNLSEENFLGKIKGIGKFIWNDIIRLIAHLWFIWIFFYIFYKFWDALLKVSPMVNFFGAIVTYTAFVMLGTYFLYNDFSPPFIGIWEFLKQITGQVPTIKESFTNNASNASNVTGGLK